MSLEEYIAGMDADREKAAQREKWLEEAADALEIGQRQAAETSPYGRFSSRIPVDVGLTPEEHDQLLGFERAAFERYKPLAQAKEEQKRAFVGAGGDEGTFDAHWAAGGKEATIAQLAETNLERAVGDDNVF